MFASSAELTTKPAPPDALPVLIEPVAPSIEIELLPPNCVVLAPRKNVLTGAFVPNAGTRAWMKLQKSCPPEQSWPSPTVSGTVPWISIAWP